jgi:hypothetical protein
VAQGEGYEFKPQYHKNKNSFTWNYTSHSLILHAEWLVVFYFFIINTSKLILSFGLKST